MIRSKRLAALLLIAAAVCGRAQTAAAQVVPAPDAAPARQNLFYGETPATGDGPVLLFVHGINGVASDWWTPANDMYALAFKAGYRTAFVSLSEDNTRNNDGITPNALILRQAILATVSRYRTSRLYIVAHSKGGVDVQAAMLDASTSLRVRAVFTLATPHQGTELADWAFGAGQAQAAQLGLVSPAVAALTTNSMLLFRSLADPASFLNGVPYYTVSGSTYTFPPNALTSKTGPVLSALTAGQPNDGVVIVPRSKLPTTYATDLGTVPANHFALALGSAVFARVNAQIRAIEGNNEFKVVATKGFQFDGAGNPLGGDRQNSFPWSMQWFKGRLYVGTGRAFACVALVTADVANGTHSYPGTDPDVECTADPTDLPLAGEIWRLTPETNTWERVFKSPVDVPIVFDSAGNGIKFTARDIAYRGMTVFVENTPAGAERLYVGAVSASSLYDRMPGYVGPGARQFPPPRLLWTEDGTTWNAVPQTPGTFLGNIGVPTDIVNRRGFRSLVTLRDRNGVNRLFATVSDAVGVGRVIASSNPAAGNNAWRQVSPAADVLPIFTLYTYRSQIYATVGEKWYPNGYAVFKTDGETPDPQNPSQYLFTPVVQGDGMQLLRPRGAISMQEFQGRLYVGSDRPPELIRINPDDSWDLIVGPPRMTASGFKWPLSGVLGKGFNSLTQGHFYSMAVHDNALYLGTWDWSQTLQYTVLNPLFKWSYGFDFFKSRDGVHWSVIDRNGLGDPYNASIRNMTSTPFGLYVGATNAQFGLQIFRSAASLDLNKDGVIDQRDVNVIVAARNQRATGPGDPRDLDLDGVITLNDSRKLATQCTRLNCVQATATRVAPVADLAETTEFVNGTRVRLSWTPVTGAVRYQIYRADPISLDTFLPPTYPIPLPDGTTVTFAQLKAQVLAAICQDPAFGEICASLDFFLNGTFMAKTYQWVGSSVDPMYLDAAPPTNGQALYYVAVEDAAGRLSDPSNSVTGPDQPNQPVLAQLGDRLLRLRPALGDAQVTALGRQVSSLAEAVTEWRLDEARSALDAIDETLRAEEAALPAVVAEITGARESSRAIRTFLKVAEDEQLPRALVTGALVGDTQTTDAAPSGGRQGSK